ncbi:MAG: arginase family protein [Candidatus Thorarchaeota archaeon]|nr:arginase family protein [Candidatus Thorarchaeota archaeon]
MPLRDGLNGYLRLHRGFFGIPSPEAGDPDVGVLGIPYDITSSHTPGARFGPDAIRLAMDSERSHSFPLTITKAVNSRSDSLSKLLTLEDIGDLEVGVQPPESVAVHMDEAAAKLATSSSKLLFLGGDHFITYPLLRGLKKGRPGNYGLVYFDSHADFYDDMGGLTLSHASTLKRLVEDNVVQLENVVGYDFRTTVPEQRAALGPSVCVPNEEEFEKQIKRISENVDYFYISVDLDVLQPQIVPGVSHPESGGLTVSELANLIRIVFETGKVRYADIVELNPLLDNSNTTSIAARDIVKEILTGFAYHK